VIFILKRYYSDPWLRNLDTKILSQHQEDDRHLVVLEETIFYPTGGGQPHDLGSVNGVSLIDVFEKDGVVFHALEHPLQGDDASCVLDWPRRLDHMQQHSGQHLLSAVFHDDYGYRTESFHLGEEYCSIDISTPSLSNEDQIAVETKVNTVVFSNLPLLTYTLSPGERGKVPLRKIPNLDADLRIVEIQGLDYSPCSGTHVSSTSQIGLVKIIKSEKYKGMTRVYFLCGDRALRDYGRKQEVCHNLGSLLSVPEEALHERMALELERKQELEKKILELTNELMDLRAQSIVAQGASPFYLESPNATIEEARQLAHSVLNLATGTVIIRLGERLVLAHNQADTLHLGQLIKEKAGPLGGRGGGNATGAQVYFPDRAGLREFLSALKIDLESD
jgi:alanyl-tRNA synthetase